MLNTMENELQVIKLFKDGVLMACKIETISCYSVVSWLSCWFKSRWIMRSDKVELLG